MIIENKETYTLVTTDENLFKEFFSNFSKELNSLKKEHLVIQLSENLNSTTKDILLFLDVAEQHKSNGTSFVVVKANIDIDEFPEDFNIAPTLIEAEDILEMEAIERDLGF